MTRREQAARKQLLHWQRNSGTGSEMRVLAAGLLAALRALAAEGVPPNPHSGLYDFGPVTHRIRERILAAMERENGGAL